MEMKKEYTTPEVEKVEFNYREQVVASLGCKVQYTNIGTSEDNQCVSDKGSTNLN